MSRLLTQIRCRLARKAIAAESLSAPRDRSRLSREEMTRLFARDLAAQSDIHRQLRAA
jgi:hypothetical protein